VLLAAVEAIYLHLMADHHLFYEFELAFNEATGEQTIQLPAVTVQEKKGACIDLILYEERGKERQRLWRIYHTSFQDYLREEVDPELKTYHAMIARWALKKVGKWKEKQG
jgi:hypothetical protein